MTRQLASSPAPFAETAAVGQELRRPGPGACVPARVHPQPPGTSPAVHVPSGSVQTHRSRLVFKSNSLLPSLPLPPSSQPDSSKNCQNFPFLPSCSSWDPFQADPLAGSAGEVTGGPHLSGLVLAERPAAWNLAGLLPSGHSPSRGFHGASPSWLSPNPSPPILSPSPRLGFSWVPDGAMQLLPSNTPQSRHA